MRPSRKRLAAALAIGAAAAGCGKSAPTPLPFAGTGASGQGVIALATKNTTRLGGADPVIDATAAARAGDPGLTPATRPQGVVGVDDARPGTARAAPAPA